jgi:hypothetical protein
VPRSTRSPLPLAAGLLLVTSAMLPVGCGAPAKVPAAKGKLTVLVRPPDRKQEPVTLNTPGALPARTGGAMYLEAQLEKPAFVYLIWIDAAGELKPLYPWNNESIEITDFDQPPPVRRATNRVFSPMLGRDWALDGPPGLETVLLLARETALPPAVTFSELLSDLPQPHKPERPDEFSTFSVAPDGKSVEVARETASGKVAQDNADDDPLKQWLLSIAKHFDLVRAVRFPHQD